MQIIQNRRVVQTENDKIVQINTRLLASEKKLVQKAADKKGMNMNLFCIEKILKGLKWNKWKYTAIL